MSFSSWRLISRLRVWGFFKTSHPFWEFFPVGSPKIWPGIWVAALKSLPKFNTEYCWMYTQKCVYIYIHIYTQIYRWYNCQFDVWWPFTKRLGAQKIATFLHRAFQRSPVCQICRARPGKRVQFFETCDRWGSETRWEFLVASIRAFKISKTVNAEWFLPSAGCLEEVLSPDPFFRTFWSHGNWKNAKRPASTWTSLPWPRHVKSLAKPGFSPKKSRLLPHEINGTSKRVGDVFGDAAQLCRQTKMSLRCRW